MRDNSGTSILKVSPNTTTQMKPLKPTSILLCDVS